MREKEKQNIFGKYCKQIAIIVLIIAVILLTYILYKVIPIERRREGFVNSRKIRGGCACTQPGYGGNYRV